MPVNDTTRQLALEARVSLEEKERQRQAQIAQLNQRRFLDYDDARQAMRRQVADSLQAIRAYEQGTRSEPKPRRRVTVGA